MHLPLGQPPPAFKPYTVTDYQAIKKADAVTRLPTSLGPPTDPESEARRAKAMAAHEYAERLRSMGSRQRSMTM
ncbi:hypothetical protein BCR44DRAFT_1154201 [Catenaria anguillulae PL171]|uniref:Uncharacterized protein n=1 Tax=Catenaria anguillulae PL171 TaxID=765915 RepID=A0A1Y2HIW0_9FUNG|nr:hypothetical protein BCR44DRAFT_1154201 [Catenaria anguillulae PL171]